MAGITSGSSVASQAQMGSNTVGTEQIIDDDIVAADIAANAVGDSEIAAHSTTKITVPTTQLSGTIAEAQIADNAVTLAKMAGGTDGELITFDANGDPAAVAVGTAGQVLSSNGAGAAPAFAAVPATSFFVPMTDVNNAFTLDSGTKRYLSYGDSGNVESWGVAFMPDVAITSMEIVYLATANSGNIVYTFSPSDYVDGADTRDTTLTDQTLAISADNNKPKFATLPSTGYDGLTKGRVWGFFFARSGVSGGDTLTGDFRVMGILVNL